MRATKERGWWALLSAVLAVLGLLPDPSAASIPKTLLSPSSDIVEWLRCAEDALSPECLGSFDTADQAFPPELVSPIDESEPEPAYGISLELAESLMRSRYRLFVRAPVPLPWVCDLKPHGGVFDLSGCSQVSGGAGFRSEIVLVSLVNRWYDPQLARFISQDPLGYVDGPNQYQYALNSPFNYTDPTGEICELFNGGKPCSYTADKISAWIDRQESKLESSGYGIGAVIQDTVVGSVGDFADLFTADVLQMGASAGEAIGSGEGAGGIALAVLTDLGRVATVVPAAGAAGRSLAAGARSTRVGSRLANAGRAAGLTRAIARSGAAGSAVALSVRSRVARTVLRPAFRAVGRRAMRTQPGRRLTAMTTSKRFFATPTKGYPGVNYGLVGRTAKRLLPGQRWQQHHVFIQQRWFKGASRWYANDPVAQLGMRRLGNAGLNLMPLPARLNRALGQSSWATVDFAIGTLAVATAPYRLFDE